MRTSTALILTVSAMAMIGRAGAADFAETPVYPLINPVASAPYSWTGIFSGAHVGSGLTATRLDNPVGATLGTGSLYGNRLEAPGAMIGLQGGFNWQMPNANWLVGIEGDISQVTGRSTGTCLTGAAIVASANCDLTTSWSGSLVGRLGATVGSDNRILLYGKGGLGFFETQLAETDNYTDVAPKSVSKSVFQTGLVYGGGLELALSNAISLQMDYTHYQPGSISLPTTYTISGTQQILHAHPGLDTFKLGVNYHLGHPGAAPWEGHGRADAIADSLLEVEVGTRYWYSVGRFQKDLANGPTNTSSLVSRLTYQDTSNNGELFAKVEAPENVFLRGTVGIGRFSTSKLNDEDWLGSSQGPTIPYSNTLSGGSGQTNYAIADIGYDLLRDGGNKLGVFAGYSYLYERHDGVGCTQTTNLPYICGPGQVNPGVTAISETDQWHGLRLGLSGSARLTDRLTVSADVAYLPVVTFIGRDNHWLRNLVISEKGHGQGTEAEAVLTYAVTDEFSIGAGARYWALWASDGVLRYNGTPSNQPMPFRTTRAGVFVQGSYKFATGG